VYVKFQDTEFFQSSSSFRLVPPPAVLNLQKVDRDTRLQSLVSKHLEGLNSQDLRDRVIQNIDDDPKSKAIILAPFMRDGVPVSVGSAVSYSVGVSPAGTTRPSFTISSVFQGVLKVQS